LLFAVLRQAVPFGVFLIHSLLILQHLQIHLQHATQTQQQQSSRRRVSSVALLLSTASMQDPGAAAEEHETHTRPEKRQRLHQEVEEEEAGGQVTVEDADGDGPPPGPPPAAQLSAALAKIANHISNSTKFAKASQLLRQVMDAVDKAHRCAAVTTMHASATTVCLELLPAGY
jgi:hypothetical protein